MKIIEVLSGIFRYKLLNPDSPVDLEDQFNDVFKVKTLDGNIRLIFIVPPRKDISMTANDHPYVSRGQQQFFEDTWTIAEKELPDPFSIRVYRNINKLIEVNSRLNYWIDLALPGDIDS